MKYDKMVANPPKPTQKLTKQSTKQPVEKQMELQYARALPKDKTKGSSAPYRFENPSIMLTPRDVGF